MTTIPLNKLKFGDDFPGGSINARRSGKEEGLAELGATIIDKGLIHALVIKTAGGKSYVADGNRRLKAMRMLVGDKRLPKDWPVKVEEIDPGVDPLEASLTANIMQLPMHPVDQYEAFAKLSADGKSVADIASSFGTSDLVVNRRLALGRLSPKLRDAWREDRLTAEAAQAFTVTQDHDLQDQVFATLAKGSSLYRHSIIRALTRSDQAFASDLAYVGRDAYLAAGGRMVEDLFAEEVHVMDPDLLKRLEREKVEVACQALIDEGWAWAALMSDLPHDRWKWPKAEVVIIHTEAEMFRLEELGGLVDTSPDGTAAAFRAREAARQEAFAIRCAARTRSFMPEDKARSGCVLRIDHDGKLSVEYGIVRPGDEPAAAGPLDPAEEGAPISVETSSDISAALAQAVSEQLTIAAAKALALDPDMALRLVVATPQARCSSPARISLNGFSGLQGGKFGSVTFREVGLRPTFADALVMTEGSSRTHLLVELAALIAPSLDLTETARINSGKAVAGRAALIDALDADDYLAAAREAFDPDVYFDRAPAGVAIAAVIEMGGEKPVGKKGVVALAAATMARDLGWLPSMMRSSHYVPPMVAGAQDEAPERKGRRRKASTDAVAP